MIKYFNLILLLFVTATMSAQTIVSGKVVDSNSGIPIPGVNIKVVGGATGVATNFDGEYTITVKQNPPFELQASSVGFQSTKISVNKKNQKINFSLQEGTILDEVVVSASRTPERIFESPVTIERMDIKTIENVASPSFYDGLENLKGVDINTSSLTFKSVNTRGFAAFSNTRFMQLVDGMDNSSPALNFALGNLLGISELDVQGVEILPGAASALYGANAFNGILFMTSKSPFDHQGVSTYAKIGATVQDAAGNNGYYDVGVRVAKAFSDKFAAKASISYLKGTEWYATDYRNVDPLTGEFIAGDRSNSNYDGLNTYGDEVSTTLDFKDIALSQSVPANIANLLENGVEVSRSGYNEEDLMDYDAESTKIDVALHYRPNGDDLEVIWNSKLGVGNTIYQGANRYSIKNFLMQQHKLEVKNDHFFARAYMTAENAGDSYDTRFAAINLNSKWKSNEDWFTQYAGTYVNQFVGAVIGGNSSPDTDAIHQAARTVAQTGVLVPGTSAFNDALAEVVADPNVTTGAKFVDKSKIYHADFNYNFKDNIEFAEIQIGGSARRYSLNSEGTIFTDYDGAIDYDEFGVYVQGQKKVLDDKLKITGSVRYDKAQNFDGFVSPRASLVYSVDDDKKHNLRVSYQTGFRNPTTQDQYIGLNVGRAYLVGSAPDNIDRYDTEGILIKNAAHPLHNTEVTLNGSKAYDNSFTLSSLEEFAEEVPKTSAFLQSVAGGSYPKAVANQLAAGANIGLLEQSDVAFVKPEKVTAFEFGYRGLINKLVVDFSAYYNDYEDFIGNKTVIVPLYGDVSGLPTADVSTDANAQALLGAIGSGDYKPFQTYTNSAADIQSYGAALGLSTKLSRGYELGMNYTWAKFDFDQSSDPDYEAGFNTPEHKVKVSFGNQNVVKNIGFNLNVRWSDAYLWQSTFQDAVLPARTNVDAQVSFALPKLKSKVKIGGVNVGGNEYFSAPGTGAVGSQYYLSWRTNF